MENKYCCSNPECKNDGNESYVKVLNQESVMDEQNIAQMFCPLCKSRLLLCQEEFEATC